MVRSLFVCCVVLVGTALLCSALPPKIVTPSPLSSGLLGVSYRKQLTAQGGAGGPFQWRQSSGSLPAGIQLGPGGVLSGTPRSNGTFSFTVRVTDSASQSSTKTYSLDVTEASVASAADNRYCSAPRSARFGATTDGPADLPGACINSALSSTPSPGATWSVCSSGCAFTTLQAAVNAAACGDTVELAAGETFASGKITFPAKHCDDAHWITVRTSTPDNLLPPEGTRMTPCWAGVASLPDRPPYDCPSGGPASPSRLAKILIAPSNGSVFIPGDHYRLIGLEVTRPVGGGIVGFFFHVGDGSNVVFDRMWLRGTARDEVTHGVMLRRRSNQRPTVDGPFFDKLQMRSEDRACFPMPRPSPVETIPDPEIAGALQDRQQFPGIVWRKYLVRWRLVRGHAWRHRIRRNHLYKPMELESRQFNVRGCSLGCEKSSRIQKRWPRAR